MSADDVDDLLDDLAEFDDDYEAEPEEDDFADLDDADEEEWDEPETDEEASAPEPESLGVQTRKGRGKAPAEPAEALLSRPVVKASALIASPATKTSEAIRRPLISGHCAHPATNEDSHKRCKGFQRANPDKIYQPCPCLCHFPEARYECGNCGATIVAAPHWPSDEDGDTRYLHVDQTKARIVAEECPR